MNSNDIPVSEALDRLFQALCFVKRIKKTIIMCRLMLFKSSILLLANVGYKML